jgi:hypothetical protein
LLCVNFSVFRFVKELSGEALQILSTALGIHLAFWAWVVSNDASDGSWVNTHSELSTAIIVVTEYCGIDRHH